MSWEVREGDCLELMRAMPAASVDSIVTDPPYGLSFMGSEWDHGVPGVPFWAEALRVAKPGAMLLAFGGTRTYHRLACALEDAGWELRDCLAWLYGSGFPKSLAVDKAIDRQRDDRTEVLEVTAWIRGARDAAGVTNRDIDAAFGFAGMAGHWTSASSQPSVPTLEQVPTLLGVLGVSEPPPRIRQLLVELNGRKGEPGQAWYDRPKVGEARGMDLVHARPVSVQAQGLRTRIRTWDLTAPATPEAQAWEGWGTALKPAWEPILLAMAPLDGTFASNALRHGVAGLHVDGCRIAGEVPSTTQGQSRRQGEVYGADQRDRRQFIPSDLGRWPANVLLDEEAAADLDEQVGLLSSGANPTRRGTPKFRTAYGEFLGQTECEPMRGANSGGPSRYFYCAKASAEDRGEGNTHPTVKPRDLMRWCCALTRTPTGGLVLDPFAGSGSTGVGAILAGRDFLGMEREPRFAAIARERLARVEFESTGGEELVVGGESATQLGLFGGVAS